MKLHGRALLVSGAWVLVLLGGERAASASPFYPRLLRELAGAAEPPPCIVCHESPAGGFGTATKPFALYLRSRGLKAGDEAALRGAFAAAAGERHDSDGDGVLDVDELKAGTDPNAGGAGPPPPEYGCGGNVVARRADSDALEGGVVLAAFAFATLLRRRRRRLRGC